MPELTISLVLHNSLVGLEACLDAIGGECEDGLAEVVAIDNASPDASLSLVRERLPQAQVLRSARNLGFAAGSNLAWPCVRGRYWLLLNPDTVVPRGTLRAMVAWMDARPAVGVASPQLVERSGRPAPTARRFPSIGLSLLELSRLHLLLSRQQRGRLLLGTYLSGTHETRADWVPGTAMLLRRDAVEQVGLLSSQFFMYGEDVEYCWRMQRFGWQVRVPRGLVVTHLGSTSAEQSWGELETLRRSIEGWYRACAVTRGRLYARVLLLVDWLALRVEGDLPWRSEVARAVARRKAAALPQVLRVL